MRWISLVLVVLGMFATVGTASAFPAKPTLAWSDTESTEFQSLGISPLTASEQAAQDAHTVKMTGMVVRRMLADTKACYGITHTVTSRYAGVVAYKTHIHKTWCSTQSLYPIVIEPIGATWWAETYDYSFDYQGVTQVIANGWWSVNYTHQTLVEFKFHHWDYCHGCNTFNRYSKNSVCAMILGRYTTTNDCDAGAYKYANAI